MPAVLSIACLFGPLTCGALAVASDPGATIAQPVAPKTIIGGERTADGEFPAVVALVATNQEFCTGTFVAPTVILTAGHCLLGLTENDSIWIHIGSEIGDQTPIRANGWGIHPQFCLDCEFDLFDYGFVTVAEPPDIGGELPKPITLQSEWDALLQPDREVTLVGYGDDPDEGKNSRGTKRKVETRIDRITPKGLEFYAGGDSRDSCTGDSGGPAFAMTADGTWRLAGITSRGTDPCGGGGYYGAPYPALCWLREETGVDLLDGTCQQCDCLDTSPPPQDGCTVAPPANTPGAWMWLVLLAGGVPRRSNAARRRASWTLQ